MSITVGGVTFDHVRYDSEADVLYLHVGEPADATEFDESPEGHALRFDDSGELVGLTIVNAKALLESGEPVAQDAESADSDSPTGDRRRSAAPDKEMRHQ